LLQLAVIYAARGDDKAAAATTEAKTAAERYASIDARLGVVERWIESLAAPSTPAAHVAAALRAALGERATEVGRILTGPA
jgi:hypothetical protein